ncbi:uncharacterized protein LOC115414645 [Sphaeramia orbicularis]|uniref:uncharacterized protein LOC115414645 n=1 Tax=Sphaeramia orbicularis TaxID=375764 RepID=UPI001180AC61|nr:uncharacterized protein LOC115414645 [Sphaeramia orbicularis]
MYSFRSGQVFCLLLLYLTDVTGDLSILLAREGEQVAFPCRSKLLSQARCNNTWIFGSTTGVTVELTHSGKMTVEDQSDRLSVAADCSLVIKKVTAEDAGLYTCRHFDESGKQQDEDIEVDLSVVTLTEHISPEEVMLNCSVWRYRWCRHTVQWLLHDNKVDGDHNMLTTTHSVRLATVTFPVSGSSTSSQYYQSLRCEVTSEGHKVQVFFSPSPLEERTDTTRTVTPRNEWMQTTKINPMEGKQQDCSLLHFIMMVARVVEVVLILVIIVLLIRAQGNKRPTNHTVCTDEDEADGTVRYENMGEPSVSVRLR